MKNIKIILIISMVILMVFSNMGCKRAVSPKEMYTYINNPDKGLFLSKTAGEMIFSVKYLPAEILAYREYKYLKNNLSYDSILNTYVHAMTFLLRIGMEDTDGEGVDPAKEIASSYGAYSTIINRMSFNMKEYLYLRVGGEKITPDLVHFESTVEVKNEKVFYVTFAVPGSFVNDSSNSIDIDFVFNDLFFGTGINHFLFRSSSIRNIPKLKL